MLPMPGDMKRLKDHDSIARLNTALNLTLHAVRLTALYLGIKLPFQPDMAAFGPGFPGMRPGGVEGGWHAM